MAPSPARETDPEARLAALVRRYGQRHFWFHRHPWAVLRAVVLLRQLPTLQHHPSGTFESRLVTEALPTSPLARFTVVQQARNVLALPTDGTPYNAGRRRATQRRKARKAQQLGVTSELVDDPATRRELLALSEAQERVTKNDDYREVDPDNSELLGVDLWMAAYHQGRPIMLLVIPVDGRFAVLSYFRTMTDSEAASTARYLMTERLAEELVGRGVHYLADHVNPMRLYPGLFHFARMVGFRIARVRVRGTAALLRTERSKSVQAVGG